MEIRWLEDFRALARTRHFSRAADEQNITQPTFSRRIKMLEEEMGVMLIDRETLPLSLTPAGKLFLEASEKITRLLKETKDGCLELERAEAEKLRFATNQTLYLSFFQGWLDSLETDIELGVNLKATSWVGRQLIQALEHGECDLILCYWSPVIDFLQPLETYEYQHLVLASETLMPVTALDRSGEPKFLLPGSKKTPLPYINYNDQTFIRQVLESHFRKNTLQMPNLLNINENSQAISVKAMIAQGYGVGWLPSRLLSSGGDQGLVAAGDESWQFPLQIRLYRSRNNSHSKMAELWTQVEKSVKQQTVSL
ncbi:LysR family transcriptional regulator [Motiliproteus sp. MSK22-1]|uniref:LysR family transcriptional regulator n=1 Tax=Motiliproteus sp. MSK22-1 TaxID=1897630 RepID=UPI000975847F|nr:LysR family transcriptional regulator [Motiliproteus sp. MSK22-1]OMH38101.1 transcriptional regulator [Motiliproteus sp. MSK22-1]